MELASLAQLERCHRRHDDVMAGLLEAARKFAAGRAAPEDLAAIHDAVAYFERSVTRHFLDEEGSVFPRLSTRRPELAPELASLSAEHPAQIELQGMVAAAARQLDEGSRPGPGKALLDAAMRLAEAHTAHVGREDALFLIAQEALTAEDDAEIVAEMETRRDRDHGGRGGGGGDGGGGGGGRRRRQQEIGAGGPAGPADPTLDMKPVTATSEKRSSPKKPKAKPARAAKTAKKKPAKKTAKPARKAASKKSAANKPKKPAKKRR